MLGDYIAELCVAVERKDKKSAEKILKKLEKVGMDKHTAMTLVRENLKK